MLQAIAHLSVMCMIIQPQFMPEMTMGSGIAVKMEAKKFLGGILVIHKIALT